LSVYVTDTHPLLWFVGGRQRRLSLAARRAFERADAGRALIYVPLAVLWEILLLSRGGRIALHHPFDFWVAALLRKPGFATWRHWIWL
jgi:PIN domain nuclease of toxin-antitoxin system